MRAQLLFFDVFSKKDPHMKKERYEEETVSLNTKYKKKFDYKKLRLTDDYQ